MERWLDDSIAKPDEVQKRRNSGDILFFDVADADSYHEHQMEAEASVSSPISPYEVGELRK
jgi:hypothetical protein